MLDVESAQSMPVGIGDSSVMTPNICTILAKQLESHWRQLSWYRIFPQDSVNFPQALR
jgi:hypothetical protein